MASVNTVFSEAWMLHFLAENQTSSVNAIPT